MGAAIWSSDPAGFERFPARFFAQFFHNHGFLDIRQPQWLTLTGGSRQYLDPITRGFRERIRVNCPVASIRRLPERVEVSAGGKREPFDAVVIASHSDQALALLADPSEAEREILGAIPYQENRTVLHTDSSILPRRKAAWAAWNYLVPERDAGGVALTYDMNILQSLAAPVEFCVSLNLEEKPGPGQGDPAHALPPPGLLPGKPGRPQPPEARSTASTAPTMPGPTGATGSTRTGSTVRSRCAGISGKGFEGKCLK
jgi:uncharacterized protein